MKVKAAKNGDRLAEINIIPLVDVVLVLLIIFMVTAPMLKEGIDIDLPEVGADSVESQQDDFIVSIDSLGRIYLNEDKKEKYSIVSVEERLEEIFTDRKKKEIYLKADRGIKYGYVMEVMAAAQRAGVQRVGMITNPPQSNVPK